MFSPRWQNSEKWEAPFCRIMRCCVVPGERIQRTQRCLCPDSISAAGRCVPCSDGAAWELYLAPGVSWRTMATCCRWFIHAMIPAFQYGTQSAGRCIDHINKALIIRTRSPTEYGTFIFRFSRLTLAGGLGMHALCAAAVNCASAAPPRMNMHCGLYI
jgi:hypothetical protein